MDRIGEDSFFGELAAEDREGIVVFLVILNFLGGAVFRGIGVCDRVAVVAVGFDLEDGGLVLLARTLHGDMRFRPDFVDVGAVDHVPLDVVGLRTLGEAAAVGRRALLRGAHRVSVVFDDVDDGDFEKGGNVEGFVECALVDGSIAEIGEAAAFLAEIFHAVCETESQGCLSGNDAVATPVILIGSEEVHRSAFTFGAASLLSIKLRHAFFHVHAGGEGVGMAAVCGDVVVVLAAERKGSHGNGFLADVKMKEAAHAAGLLVIGEGDLLETSDPHHQGVESDFLLGSERLVDRRGGEIEIGHGARGYGESGAWLGGDGGGGKFYLAASGWT